MILSLLSTLVVLTATTVGEQPAASLTTFEQYCVNGEIDRDTSKKIPFERLPPAISQWYHDVRSLTTVRHVSGTSGSRSDIYVIKFSRERTSGHELKSSCAIATRDLPIHRAYYWANGYFGRIVDRLSRITEREMQSFHFYLDRSGLTFFIRGRELTHNSYMYRNRTYTVLQIGYESADTIASLAKKAEQ